MEGAVTVNAIPSNYVGSGITQRSSSDMYESGNAVYAPSGYYAEQSSKTVSSGTVKTTNVVSVTPTISVSGAGLITATVNGGGTITPIDTAGYMDTSASVSVQASGTATEQMTLRTSGDLTANGATVTAPAGYYAAQASKSVQSGTVSNPTASKGTVSNNSISVTPSVTVATGYVAGGTRVGTAVSVSASELVSGSQTITSNNTYDVTNLASVVVNVSGGSPNLQAKTNIDPTESSQTITADTGYDGLSSVQINAIPSDYVGSGITERSSSDLNVAGAMITAPSGYYPSGASASVSAGTAGTPTATKGTVSNHSVSVTPRVTNTTGYISGGTLVGTAVTVSASELVSGTKSITSAGTSDVTNYASVNVQSGTAGTPVATKGTVNNHSINITPSVTNTTGFITGSTKTGSVVNVTASELVSGDINITSAGTIDVADYANAIVPVGTEGTPVAQKGTVTNHSVSVSPSVTNSAGYIAGSTKIGSSVTVTASELVSGSQTITANNTYDVTDLAEVVVNVSGGATNVVIGTFTTASTAGAKTQTLAYTGTGYPIAAMVFIDGGAYNSDVTGWYNSVQRYAVGQWTYSKSVTTSTPTYGTSGTQNQGVTTWIYKNSTSSSTTYSRSSAMNTIVLSSSNSGSAGATCVRFKSATSMSYYVATSNYGLLPSTTYKYIVIYSS